MLLTTGVEQVWKSWVTVQKTDSNETRRRQAPTGADNDDDDDEKQKWKRLENKVVKISNAAFLPVTT